MNFSTFLQKFIDLGTQIIPLLGAIAFLMFVIGVGRFIRSSGNDTERQKTKNLLIYGIIGLFVLTTIWGIIAFIRKEFGFTGTPVIPQVKL